MGGLSGCTSADRKMRGGSTLSKVCPAPSCCRASMHPHLAATQRKRMRLLRFGAVEETVDYLAKGRDGLGTFDKGCLDRTLCTRFADEEARCAGNPDL